MPCIQPCFPWSDYDFLRLSFSLCASPAVLFITQDTRCALWSRIAKNTDRITGPLICPFACSLAPHCSFACSTLLSRSLACTFRSLPRLWKNFFCGFLPFWTIVDSQYIIRNKHQQFLIPLTGFLHVFLQVRYLTRNIAVVHMQIDKPKLSPSRFIPEA